jgi:UPF0755 protein
MKRILDVLYYILGVLFNVCFTVILITMLVVITFQAFDFGEGLFVENLDTRPDKEVTVVIPDGKNTLEVAEILHKNGLIDNTWVFFIQSRLNGSYKHFLSDTFTLNMNMGSSKIMQELQSIPERPIGDQIRVTIFEGMTIAQMAKHVEAEGLFSAQAFLAATEKEYEYPFLRNLPARPFYLQGYLFPDTYILPENPTPEDLIIRMLDRFSNVFYSSFSVSLDSPYNMDEIVIIASIIEKEIRAAGEHELASAVIHNRLKSNAYPYLQMCSTVQYVLDKPRANLTTADLQIQSPYNTYINRGLPPGPICSPGLKALEAAQNPADVNYLFFVLKDDGTGSHVFTASYSEFLAAKALYNNTW